MIELSDNIRIIDYDQDRKVVFSIQTPDMQLLDQLVADMTNRARWNKCSTFIREYNNAGAVLEVTCPTKKVAEDFKDWDWSAFGGQH